MRALLLQALYTLRSERQLMEQLDYNLLFRWFVGLGMDDPVWAPTTFVRYDDVRPGFAHAVLAGRPVEPYLLMISIRRDASSAGMAYTAEQQPNNCRPNV